MQRIYLDNASTTPLSSSTQEAMRPYLQENFGNASSIHSFGQKSKHALESARESVAKCLDASPSEVIFTSGGTESNNAAIKGIFFAQWPKKNHIITSTLEHKAVLECVEWLKTKFSARVSVISHSPSGRLDLTHLRDMLSNDTALVTVMHANNELGRINDIIAISELCHERGIPFHTDAVQSTGKLEIKFNQWKLGALSLSAHKFYGPKGVGALLLAAGTPFEAWQHGGTHERNRRAGTENVPLAVGLSHALMEAATQREANYALISSLSAHFKTTLYSEFKDTAIRIEENASEGEKLPHILNLSFHLNSSKTPAADVLLLGLDAEGIAVSSGSACNSGTERPSHVLMALGKSETEARLTCRISFSKFNTLEEVEMAAKGFQRTLSRFI